MNPAWTIQTGRLSLRPVGWSDLADMTRLKGDPRAFAVMLGGVRTPLMAADELAADIAAWSQLGYGVWTVRVEPGRFVGPDRFVGMVALQTRADGRGVAMRFALLPGEHGRGYAAEAAGAALRFGHDRCGLSRIVAVAREDNFASRTVLGSIGMRPCDSFERDGVRLILFESVRQSAFLRN
jgi:RimJ/RimL family protein N-acetyltransferase